MICPKCGTEQAESNKECMRCGVIFAKLTAEDYADSPGDADLPAHEATVTQKLREAQITNVAGLFKELLFHIEPEENRLIFGGRVVAYAVFLVWGIRFIITSLNGEYLMNSFMHSINLPFHEAGHILFSIFGGLVTVLGGSFLQLLIPAVCAGAFIIYRNQFAASIALWWLAQNFMDLAPYIDDARTLDLPLLGGITGSDDPDFHDWHTILGSLGWLRYDHALARTSFGIGIALMILSLVWGGYILLRQYRTERPER